MIWFDEKSNFFDKTSLMYFDQIFTDLECKNALLSSDIVRRPHFLTLFSQNKVVDFFKFLVTFSEYLNFNVWTKVEIFCHGVPGNLKYVRAQSSPIRR